VLQIMHKLKSISPSDGNRISIFECIEWFIETMHTHYFMAAPDSCRNHLLVLIKRKPNGGIWNEGNSSGRWAQ